MTGIERLRTLAGAWDAYGLGGALGDVARQIERERACDADTIENVRLIVGGVIDSMERHVSGVEGAEDSPVAHWARELRYALKSDSSDECDAQKPSCHDHAETADETSDAQKVTRDPAEDVSMSAYDLLPADEREAIAWVREHGGLERVKGLLDWVVGHCSTKQQLEFDFWLSGRVMHELGFEGDMADRDEVERRLLARLMPEGMEWPKVEGKPVVIGERLVGYGSGDDGYEVVGVRPTCDWVLVKSYDNITRDGGLVILEWDASKCQRPAPKVLDADGVEIRVGDEVWPKYPSDRDDAQVIRAIVLTLLGDGRVEVESEYPTGMKFHEYVQADQLTHRAPVLAADGKPLREGETAWLTTSGREIRVDKIEHRPDGFYALELFADGSKRHSAPVSILAHERPDSWERLEEDAGKSPCDYFGFDEDETCGKCPASAKNCEQTMARDLVRRAKALAERGEW